VSLVTIAIRPCQQAQNSGTIRLILTFEKTKYFYAQPGHEFAEGE
jgi:hypothetical protein